LGVEGGEHDGFVVEVDGGGGLGAAASVGVGANAGQRPARPLYTGWVGRVWTQGQGQRQRTGVSVPHGRRFAPLTAEAAVST